MADVVHNDDITDAVRVVACFDTLPSTETLPASAWEAASINANGEEVASSNRLRTIGYIQLREGDIISAKQGVTIDVFEYDLTTKAFKSAIYTSGWKTSYTVQTDCFVRILLYWNNTTEIETMSNRTTITRNTNTQICFPALPIEDLQEMTKTVVADQTDGIETNLVTKTKFTAARNPLFKQSAHRGFRGTGAPQCTAPTYIEAKKFGFDVGENDLWITSDGIFVMAHDSTLPSDRSIVIAESTYETLYAGNMGTFNGKEVKIMTFEEWLVLMKKIGLEPFIDLKSNLNAEQAAAAVAIVRKHGMLDKVTWCSSSGQVATNIRSAHPKARIAHLSWTTAKADYIIEGRPDLTILYPQSINVTAEIVEAAHAAGVGIECWHCDYSANGFTTEEAILAEVERVVELGVTGICLDTYLPGDYFLNKLNAEWGLE
jgi:glycerophosphoryl diester phosphodiesterase